MNWGFEGLRDDPCRPSDLSVWQQARLWVSWLLLEPSRNQAGNKRDKDALGRPSL